MVRKILFCILFVISGNYCTAQVINRDKMKLANYIERLYNNAPFTGVKVIDDEIVKYFISVVEVNPEKYKGNISTIQRVASVKAVSQSSRYFNGSSVSDELIIRTYEKSDGKIDTETIETIKESSVGFTEGLELISNFENQNGEMVFVFCKVLNY